MAYTYPHNYDSPRLTLTEDDYWDFTICKDRPAFPMRPWDGSLNDRCLISQIDLSDDDCIDGEWIRSSSAYSWDMAVSEGDTLYHIGYTGLDNGQVLYQNGYNCLGPNSNVESGSVRPEKVTRDRISNADFVRTFTESKYELLSGDTRIHLHPVSGTTMQYDYPMSVSGGTAKLNGGFFQGFVKTKCDEYYALPTNFNSGYPQTWLFEFVLKKSDLEPESDKTLNDKYPDNKGLFFYYGTRAENKWVYTYNGTKEDECFALSYDDYISGDTVITKDDHIIGNFLGEVVEFPMEPKWWEPDIFIDEYTNFDYYDPEVYERPCGGWDGLEDYMDFIVRPGELCNEDCPHESVTDCFCQCCKKTLNYTVIHKQRNCGCGVTYKKEYRKRKPNDCRYYGCEFFGEDGYIGDFDGMEDMTEYIEPEFDIRYFDYPTDGGYTLREASDGYYEIKTDNKFLLFNRTKKGFKTTNWVDGLYVTYYGRREKFKDNLFLLMNRTPTGHTVYTINELRERVNNTYSYYTFYKDIYDNALAFRIDDEGRIGYRLLTVDCSLSGADKTTVMEGYSVSGAVADEEWTAVSVRVDHIGLDKMMLRFYVNGKLVFVTDKLPMIRMRDLDDMPDKQEGVPYNISLGGGTQGLAETVQLNYMLNPDRVFPLERHFAGSFIGYLSQFRFHTCALESREIWENASYGLTVAKTTEIFT